MKENNEMLREKIEKKNSRRRKKENVECTKRK